MLLRFYDELSGYKFLCGGSGGFGLSTLGGKCQQMRLPDYTIKVSLFCKQLPHCPPMWLYFPQCFAFTPPVMKTPALHILTASDAVSVLDSHHLPSQ